MRRPKLTRNESAVENALLKGEYADVIRSEMEAISRAIATRKKDAVLHIRINSLDLRNIKEKAKRLGVKYQSFIAEFLHRVAQN
ncbi:MAG TPA: hypothetical protein VI895_02075 [Bdellovibrionota bacterium]|nr:hypothetical protein [Bdellovibrionota bacterium]